MPDQKIIIAIDGHSSSGKSTVAREIAAALGYRVVNTGAMYRAVTLHALKNGTLDDRAKLIKMLPEVDFDAPVEELNSLEVSQKVSEISSIPEVRALLVEKQREMGRERGIVMEGRDIGTVVFPDAELKIFLTADPLTRASRRSKDLPDASLEEVAKNIADRDYADENRAQSPLKRAEDAIVVDNSRMTPREQVEHILKLIP